MRFFKQVLVGVFFCFLISTSNAMKYPLICNHLEVGKGYAEHADVDKVSLLVDSALEGGRKFDGRYDLETVVALCNGEPAEESFKAWIDRGYIEKSEILAIRSKLESLESEMSADKNRGPHVCVGPHQVVSEFKIGCEFDKNKYKDRILKEREVKPSEFTPYYNNYTLTPNGFFDEIEVTVNDKNEIVLLSFKKIYKIGSEFFEPVDRVIESPDFLRSFNDFNDFRLSLSKRWGKYRDGEKELKAVWHPLESPPIKEIALAVIPVFDSSHLYLVYLSNDWYERYDARQRRYINKTDGF